MGIRSDRRAIPIPIVHLEWALGDGGEMTVALWSARDLRTTRGALEERILVPRSNRSRAHDDSLMI